MGTDIHGLMERKVDGKWIPVRIYNGFKNQWDKGGYASPVVLSRNYVRFGKLASVRGFEGQPPRGMPADASDTAKHLFEVEGDHTPSWVSLEEACRIFLETQNAPDGFMEKWPEYEFFGIDEQYLKYEHRFIFWFDS